MMRTAFLLLVLVSIISFSFALTVPFVQYYSDDVSSHACNPTDSACAYTKIVYIDSNYLIPCASGVKVLGFTSNLNAHVETGLYSNYSTNVCFKSSVLSSKACYYAYGANTCGATESCLFSMDSNTNSHLSSCGIFPAGTKFCCNQTFLPPPPVTGSCNIYYLEASKTSAGSVMDISFICKKNSDVNFYIFTDKGDLIVGANTDKNYLNVPCTTVGGIFRAYTVASDSKNTTLMIRVTDKNCSKDIFVNVTPKEQGGFIPDSNPLIVILVCFMVLAMIFTSRKVNK